MSMVASPSSVTARDVAGNVCKPAVSSASSSSSSSSTSYAGKVTFLYGAEESAFGWREGLVAGEFAKQLRVAVLHVTGLPSLEGVELVLEQGAAVNSKAQRVTPRDLFQGRFSCDGNSVLIRIIPPAKCTATTGDGSAKAGIGSVTPAIASASTPPRVKFETPEAVDAPLSREAAPTRAGAKSSYAKAGGSQMQFMQLVAANKNPKAVLDEGMKLTVSEVARHRRKGDCWTIYQGKVYDITLYLDFHPGSKKELMKGAGKDCTELYNQVHPWVSIDGLLGNLCLGVVVPETIATSQDASASVETTQGCSATNDQAAAASDLASPSADPRAPAGYPQEM